MRFRQCLLKGFLAVTAAIWLMTAFGCSSSETAAPEPPTTAPSPQVRREGAPHACQQLADSESLGELPSILSTLASGTGDAQDRRVARNAQSVLDRIGNEAGQRLTEPILDAASALEDLLREGDGVPDAAVVARLTQAFSVLGEEVQAACEFPLD